jgi:hypothetical protein
MSRTAKTINHSGWVLMIAGLTLVFFPQDVALFFWKDTVADYWLRTLGYFMFIEGLISYKSSFFEVDGLFRWIINYRMLQPAFFTTLLIVDFANPGLMLYSTIELILGIYSFLAFKQDNV